MPRLKADPVDIAFRAWAALDTDQKRRLADRVAGYQEAMGVVAAPAPRTRQRKAKVNGTPELVNALAKEHERIQRLGPYPPEETAMHPLNPPKGGSGVPPKTA